MKQRIVFFDLETGGLDCMVHPVTQVAAIACDRATLKELDRMECKVQFDPRTCAPEALEVNSYDPEVWKAEAKPRMAALAMFDAFIRKHATLERTSKRGNPYTVAQLAGHNAHTFDRPFWDAWAKRVKPDYFFAADFRVMDTMHGAMWYFEGTGVSPSDYKLETICQWFEIPHDAHDAMGDVEATVKLTQMLLDPELLVYSDPSHAETPGFGVPNAAGKRR